MHMSWSELLGQPCARSGGIVRMHEQPMASRGKRLLHDARFRRCRLALGPCSHMPISAETGGLVRDSRERSCTSLAAAEFGRVRMLASAGWECAWIRPAAAALRCSTCPRSCPVQDHGLLAPASLACSADDAFQGGPRPWSFCTTAGCAFIANLVESHAQLHWARWMTGAHI